MSELGRPLVIAHRGASGLAPENSLAAFALAVELGADRIEINVRLARDGVPVVMHDATVDRTSDGGGRVSDLTWDELRRLRLRPKRGEDPALLGLPSLEQTLEHARLPLCVELKSERHEPELARAVVALLAQANLLESAWIWSFDWRDLAAVGEHSSVVKRGALALRWPGEEAMRCAELLVPFVGHQLLVRGRPARYEGWPVVVWTVNRLWMARRLAAQGVDGLVSDWPDRLLTLWP